MTFICNGQTLGQGTTLSAGSESVQVFFDEWAQATVARFWDGQSVKTAYYAEKVVVDATPEVLAAVEQYYFSQSQAKLVKQAEEEALKIRKESLVKVVSGRQSKGAVGKVVVMIERPYRMGFRAVPALKLGIATSDEMVNVVAKNGKTYSNYKDVVWAWARNVALVSPPEPDLSEVEENARARAKQALKTVYKAA